VLHKCANPACPSVFRNLGRGQLFLVETEVSAAAATETAATNRNRRSARQVERYGLCDGCSSSLALTYERERGMVTVPLEVRESTGASRASHPPHREGYGAEQT
jgi:hypothetical protein